MIDTSIGADDWVVIPTLDGAEMVVRRKHILALDSKMQGVHTQYFIVWGNDNHPWSPAEVTRETWMRFREQMIKEDD